MECALLYHELVLENNVAQAEAYAGLGLAKTNPAQAEESV